MVGLSLPERFRLLVADFLAALTAGAGPLDAGACAPLLAEFAAFLDEAELAPEQFGADVVEFYLYLLARDGLNSTGLEQRLLALKALFAWAACQRGGIDVARDLECLTREGKALEMVIYHRWPPAHPVGGQLVQLELD